MPRLMIIVASTRPGRIGLPIAQWFEGVAARHGGFELDVADLAELDLPFMDEPHHPRLRRYEHDHTKAWSERVAAADAFALVMPEYNHSFSAPLKNALDYLHHEWLHKPAGVVSYGGVSAGLRAVGALKPVLSALQMPVAFNAVSLPFASRFLDADGRIAANETMEQAAMAMLDELVQSEAALRALRPDLDAAAAV